MNENKHMKRINITAFIYTSKWIDELEEYFGYPMPQSILASYAMIEAELQKELDQKKGDNDGLQ